jgi:hypothetical protein
MHFSNYFPYHLIRNTYVLIRAICVPGSTIASALLSLHGLSVTPLVIASLITFIKVLIKDQIH